ncbi:udp-4-amino-4-deoxy-l-arabinose-oxoglutarate aminotransferase, partial [Lasius niger]
MEARDKGIEGNKERVEDIDSRVKASTIDKDSAISVVKVGKNAFVNAKLPRGGWLKNPFEELTFKGRTDPQNPMKFLRRFEKIA